MQRKRILWLTSWYPNKHQPLNGDFIQRHARAAALYNDVHVIHLEEIPQNIRLSNERHTSDGLTEQIFYYHAAKGFAGASFKQLRYFRIFQTAIQQYIRQHGLPHCVHVHIPWKAGLMALWMKRKWHMPYVVSEHWGIYNSDVADAYHTRPFYLRKTLQAIFRNADRFISVSRFLGENINQSVIQKSFCIVPNVVDTAMFSPSSQKHPQFTFLHVSNMVPLKNVDKILSAFGQLSTERKDVRLVLVGNPNDTLPNKAKEMGLSSEQVIFKGEVSYAEVAKEMQEAHCFILNSSYETFGCVVVEALCCGLPVIATNVGVVPDVLNTENGIILSEPDVDALKNAMHKMLEHYKQYNRETVAAKAAERFNYDAAGQAFDAIYNGISRPESQS